MLTKLHAVALGIIVSLGTVHIAEASSTFEIDPTHSYVGFRALHFGIGYTYGRFRDVSGVIEVDEKKPTGSSIKVEVASESVYTADKKRDKHLRSPDFLGSKQFPKITFESTKIRKIGKKRYKVVGNLTLHGVTRKITAIMTHIGQGEDAWGKYRAGFVAEAKIKLSDFGIKGMPKAVGNVLELTIAIEGIRK